MRSMKHGLDGLHRLHGLLIKSVKSINPCKGWEPRISQIAQMTRIKAFETRIRWMAQMARIFLYEQQIRLRGNTTSVKSINPCKSVIQTMEVAVWN